MKQQQRHQQPSQPSQPSQLRQLPKQPEPQQKQGWWQMHKEQEQPQQKQTQQDWWQAWDEQRWWERPQAQDERARWQAEPPPYSAPVRQLFAAFREEERRSAVPERDAKEEHAVCAECGRGRPLKLFLDVDDDQWYC